MTEGPKQVNMYGIRYFINGDLSDPYVKKLMVQARNDLHGMKDRNINDIDHIWLNKPKHYKIVSQFGIDSVYINAAYGYEKHLKIEWEEKKEKKEIEAGLYPAFEIFDSTHTKIGYMICLGNSFNPAYYLVETNNVIEVSADREDVFYAREEGITVDPFRFPLWKWYHSDDFGNLEDRPFDEEVLQNKFICIKPVNKEVTIYIDIACTFEELIFPNYENADYSEDVFPGRSAPTLYWLPVWAGLADGQASDDMWKCGAVWGSDIRYDGHHYSVKPVDYCLVTKAGWTIADDYGDLPKILSTEFCTDQILVDGVGSSIYSYSMLQPSYYDWFSYMPCPKTAVYGYGCKEWAGFWFHDEPYWAYSSGTYPERVAVPYGGWCKSQGCWDDLLVIAEEWFDLYAPLDSEEEYAIDYDMSFPDSNSWEYYVTTQGLHYQYDQEVYWGNAKDADHYAGLFYFYGEDSLRIQQKEDVLDPRDKYFESWNTCHLPIGDEGATCEFDEERFPIGEVLDDILEYTYSHIYYIEINGSNGTIKRTLWEENTHYSQIDIVYCNIRYYQLNEDYYVVLGTICYNHYANDCEKVLHFAYWSNSGFAEDLVLDHTREYGYKDSNYLYPVHKDMVDSTGQPLLANGSFRLIQVTKETEYPDEIKKYEQQLY